MYKSNNYKSTTIKTKDYSDTVQRYISSRKKHYSLPILETIIIRFELTTKQKDYYKQDCGLEEVNIINRLEKQIKQDKEKIKQSIIKSRGKYVKNLPLPKILN